MCSVRVPAQYVGEDNPQSLITEFVAGYAKHGELSATEMEVLPDLINLRVMSNVVYFTGRYVTAGVELAQGGQPQLFSAISCL